MADYTGNIVSFSLLKDANAETDGNDSVSFSQGIIEGPAITKYFLMRGVDVDCPGLTYRTWIVTDQSDPTASLYSGPKCGSSPLSQIVIAAKWVVEE